MPYKCVYRSSDYRNFSRTHLSSTDISDTESIGDKVVKRYVWAIGFERDRLNKIFNVVYGQDLNVKENELSEIYLSIKKIERETDLTIIEVCSKLKKYLGCKSFFRRENDVYKPIRIEKIGNAYTMMINKSSVDEIKNFLTITNK